MRWRGKPGLGLQAGKLEKMPPTAPHIDSGESVFAATSPERPLCPTGHHELLGQSRHGGDSDPGSPAKQASGSFTPCNVNREWSVQLLFSQAGGGGGPPELGGTRLCQHASASLGLRVQSFASVGVLQASKAEIHDVLKCTRGRGKRGAFSDPGLPVHRLPLAQELGMPT